MCKPITKAIALGERISLALETAALISQELKAHKD
jgi:hypothetical protein